MPKIYCLVGMIASGKSTYCKNAAKSGMLILNDDAIVNLLHANEYTLYDKKLKVLYKTIENSILSLSICMNKSVVIDRGLNISIQGRQRWIALAKSFDVACEAVVFPYDSVEIHASRRHANDSRGHTYHYWLGVAQHHSNTYIVPLKDEGFDKIHYINFSNILDGEVIN